MVPALTIAEGPRPSLKYMFHSDFWLSPKASLSHCKEYLLIADSLHFLMHFSFVISFYSCIDLQAISLELQLDQAMDCVDQDHVGF